MKGILKKPSSEKKVNHDDTSKGSNRTKERTRTSKHISSPSSQGYDYMVKESKEIGIIFLLCNKRFSKKLIYLTFVEKHKNYALINFEEVIDIIPIIEDRKNTAKEI